MTVTTNGLSTNITVTSKWVRWHLKSPASPLFTQPFIQAQIKENIKAPHHWPLCGGNSPVAGEFPAQMASNAENVSIWWRHHDCWKGVNKCVIWTTIIRVDISISYATLHTLRQTQLTHCIFYAIYYISVGKIISILEHLKSVEEKTFKRNSMVDVAVSSLGMIFMNNDGPVLMTITFSLIDSWSSEHNTVIVLGSCCSIW